MRFFNFETMTQGSKENFLKCKNSYTPEEWAKRLEYALHNIMEYQDLRYNNGDAVDFQSDVLGIQEMARKALFEGKNYEPTRAVSVAEKMDAQALKDAGYAPCGNCRGEVCFNDLSEEERKSFLQPHPV